MGELGLTMMLIGITCGEYIYKGRKFNASEWFSGFLVFQAIAMKSQGIFWISASRHVSKLLGSVANRSADPNGSLGKETTDEKYLNIAICEYLLISINQRENVKAHRKPDRFYIRCTRCSAEITFKTDPKAMDYDCERGANRNFEVWRSTDPDAHKLETDDERLDRLEAERAEAGGAMEELELKVHDAKREMEIADALDEIRTRNARIGRAEGREAEGEALEGAERGRREREEERRRVEEEDAEAARRAFARGVEIEDEDDEAGPSIRGGDGRALGDGGLPQDINEHKPGEMAPPPKPQQTAQPQPQTQPPPQFKRVVKKKKDFSAALGIKRKPALV